MTFDNLMAGTAGSLLIACKNTQIEIKYQTTIT